MDVYRATDLTGKEARSECFRNKTLTVISHSGLHDTEALLIERGGTAVGSATSILVAGNRTGMVALVAQQQFPASRVTCHAFDLHHAKAILRNFERNGVASVFRCDAFVESPSVAPSTAAAPFTVACTAAIPEGPYDLALFMSSTADMTGELVLDQLEDIHAQLAVGGTCLFAYQGDVGTVLKQARELFGTFSILVERKGLVCVQLVKQRAAFTRRSFQATFPASVPGGEPITLISLPGVFCHRRPDMGGLALAEVVARALKSGQRILDLGCGCGLVGLLLASRQADARVTYLDSHARALAATWANVQALGVQGRSRLVLSDSGCATGERYDVVAGNPPYYSDYRIAQLFVDCAAQVMDVGARGYLVAKSVGGLARCVKCRFTEVDIVPRRGYGVVAFNREQERS